MQEFRPEDERRESTADPGDPFAEPVPVVFPEAPAPAVFPEATQPAVFPEATEPAVFPEATEPAVFREAPAPVVFADPGDENPAPYTPAVDPFARPAFTPASGLTGRRPPRAR